MDKSVALKSKENEPPTSGERKQVTVVFIDLEGFSSIANRIDPEELQEGLDVYYSFASETIQKFGGEVSGYLGDGVVAYFGYPIADELSAIKAVNAALEILDQGPNLTIGNQSLSLRAGVATGEVAARDVSPDSHLPKITGIVTTFAERLQAQAESGTVLISADTKDLVKNHFELTKKPPKKLKGFSKPQTYYQAIARPFAQPPIQTTQIVGRANELDDLSNTTDPILIMAPAGMGKTTLTNTFVNAHGSVKNNQWFFTNGATQASSYQIFTDWLLRNLGNNTVSFAALKKAFPGLNTHRLRFLALLLGLPEGQSLMAEYSNTMLRPEIDISLWEAVKQKGQPSLLIFEDLHWIDQASLETIDYILTHADADNFQILMTSRPSEKISQHMEKHSIRSLHLEPLNTKDSYKMLASLLPADAPKDATNDLVNRSGGVPLFLEHLGQTYTQRGSDAALPNTLKDLLTERVDQTKEAKPILQLASVIGRNFGQDVLGYLMPEMSNIEKLLAQAESMGVIDRSANNIWTFKHALLQQAAYDSLLRGQRKHHHAKIADVLFEKYPELTTRTPAILGEHYEKSDQPFKAVDCYLNAGQAALNQGAFQDAERHINHAIGMLEALDESAEKYAYLIKCYTSLGSVLMQVQGFAAEPVRAAFDKALKLAETADTIDGSVAPALWGNFTHAVLSGDMTKAETSDDLLWKLSARSTNVENATEIQLAALGTANAACFYGGRFSEQFEHIKKIRKLYDFANHAPLTPLYGMDIFAAAQMFEPVARAIVGQTEHVKPLLKETHAHQELLSIPLMQPYALVWGSVPLFYSGLIEQAIESVSKGIAIATEQGAAFWQVIGSTWLNVFKLQIAPETEAVEQLAAMIDYQRAMGSGVGDSYFMACMAKGLADTGKLEEAQKLSSNAANLSEQSGVRCWYPEVHRIHSNIAHQVGDTETATTALEKCLKTANDQGAHLWKLRGLLEQHSQINGTVVPEIKTLIKVFHSENELPELTQAKSIVLSA